MNPYYQDASVTIYHGDCREILPTISNASLIITDPPYGVNLRTSYATNKRANLAASSDYAPVFGDDAPFDPSHLLSFAGAVMWGANYYADKLPPRGSWLVWDKRDGGTSDDGADAELAWVSGVSGTVPRLLRHKWRGMIKASERNERRSHPTQKPVALMAWCLSFFPDVKRVVVDPYMGSGPTLRAAKDLNRNAIGIEIDERYCEIAARRCSQEILELGAV